MDYPLNYPNLATVQSQSQASDSPELDKSIQTLRGTIFEISTTLNFIVNRVLTPEPQPAEKSAGVSPVATTYQQKIEELQFFAGRLLDTVRRLNGRI